MKRRRSPSYSRSRSRSSSRSSSSSSSTSPIRKRVRSPSPDPYKKHKSYFRKSLLICFGIYYIYNVINYEWSINCFCNSFF